MPRIFIGAQDNVGQLFTQGAAVGANIANTGSIIRSRSAADKRAEAAADQDAELFGKELLHVEAQTNRLNALAAKAGAEAKEAQALATVQQMRAQGAASPEMQKARLQAEKTPGLFSAMSQMSVGAGLKMAKILADEFDLEQEFAETQALGSEIAMSAQQVEEGQTADASSMTPEGRLNFALRPDQAKVLLSRLEAGENPERIARDFAELKGVHEQRVANYRAGTSRLDAWRKRWAENTDSHSSDPVAYTNAPKLLAGFEESLRSWEGMEKIDVGKFEADAEFMIGTAPQVRAEFGRLSEENAALRAAFDFLGSQDPTQFALGQQKALHPPQQAAQPGLFDSQVEKLDAALTSPGKGRPPLDNSPETIEAKEAQRARNVQKWKRDGAPPGKKAREEFYRKRGEPVEAAGNDSIAPTGKDKGRRAQAEQVKKKKKMRQIHAQALATVQQMRAQGAASPEGE